MKPGITIRLRASMTFAFGLTERFGPTADARADRVAARGTRARGQRERQHAQDERQRGHDDRPKAQSCRLDGRLLEPHTLPMHVGRELDDQNRVICREAHERHEPDL